MRNFLSQRRQYIKTPSRYQTGTSDYFERGTGKTYNMMDDVCKRIKDCQPVIRIVGLTMEHARLFLREEFRKMCNKHKIIAYDVTRFLFKCSYIYSYKCKNSQGSTTMVYFHSVWNLEQALRGREERYENFFIDNAVFEHPTASEMIDTILAKLSVQEGWDYNEKMFYFDKHISPLIATL